jgi:predicted AlkP superfamily pyrophosphatase or phosphodiesterase
MRSLALLPVLSAMLSAAQPLVVISVDGLDNRYLANAESMGLKIPHLRQLMREGQFARQGVIGVVPTVTWPSHTTIITGVDPVSHGILGNQRPKSEGGEYYWDASLIHTPTLLQAVHAAGKTAATITWPVTVNALVNWNLPEYFHRRRGGSMDLESIASKSKPADLVERISAAYPSFPQEWMDDRTRTLAVIYLLKREHPDLLLVHLVDLDSEEHDDAPFSRAANAVLERTDELIGQMIDALPAGSALAVVSDHGFERVNTVVNLKAAATGNGIANIVAFGGIAVAQDEPAAAWLRQLRKDPRYGIGREIPKDEWARFPSVLPANPAAVFESAEGFMFFPGKGGDIFSKPAEIGNHGHWPMRYRAVYVLWGPGIAQATLPEFSMKEIAGRLAKVLGVVFEPGAGK